MKTDNRRATKSVMTRRSFAAGICLLLALISAANTVSGQENKPIIIKAQSVVPTEPVWIDANTVAYKTCWAIRMSRTQYVPGSVGHFKYDISAGKKAEARGEYGTYPTTRDSYYLQDVMALWPSARG